MPELDDGCSGSKSQAPPPESAPGHPSEHTPAHLDSHLFLDLRVPDTRRVKKVKERKVRGEGEWTKNKKFAGTQELKAKAAAAIHFAHG